jgi:hypothetical protein
MPVTEMSCCTLSSLRSRLPFNILFSAPFPKLDVPGWQIWQKYYRFLLLVPLVLWVLSGGRSHLFEPTSLV